jgi:hypothetical protein
VAKSPQQAQTKKKKKEKKENKKKKKFFKKKPFRFCPQLVDRSPLFQRSLRNHHTPSLQSLRSKGQLYKVSSFSSFFFF